MTRVLGQSAAQLNAAADANRCFVIVGATIWRAVGAAERQAVRPRNPMRQIVFVLLATILGCGVNDAPREKAAAPRAARSARNAEHLLAWENVPPEVRDIRNFTVTVKNSSSRPIYLSRVYPFGFPQLVRFDEERKLWEEGNIPIGCGTVSDPTEPITIPPGARVKLAVLWSSSIDDNSTSPMFVPEQTPTATQPLVGRYRLRLRYALEPWTVSHQPQHIRITESPTFLVTAV